MEADARQTLVAYDCGIRRAVYSINGWADKQSLSFHTTRPIPWLPPVMGDRENSDLFARVQVDDVVRKATYRETPHRKIGADYRYW